MMKNKQQRIDNESKIEELFINFCYDREICKLLKVNYSNPSKEDYEKLRGYAKEIYNNSKKNLLME